MDPWHVAHLMFLSAWGGVVAVEIVFEARARDEASQRLAARVHHAIDLAVELPLLAGILVTGAWLTVRAWPITPLHWIKIGAGIPFGLVALYLGLAYFRA